MMRGPLTLGKRITSGFALMVILIFVVGTAGYLGLKQVSGVMTLNREINRLQYLVATMKAHSDLQAYKVILKASKKLSKQSKGLYLTPNDGVTALLIILT